MNLGIITKPNIKGQIVIPKRFRTELGINENVTLSITIQGHGVYITPLDQSLASSDSRNMFREILNRTAGAWANDSWPETEARRSKIEQQAAKDRKQAW